MLKRSLFIIITLCLLPLPSLAQEYPWGRVSKEQIEDAFLRNDSADILESATASLVISATDPESSTQALLILKHAGVQILAASANGCLVLKGEFSIREDDDGNEAVVLYSDNTDGFIELKEAGATKIKLDSSSSDSYINNGNFGIGTDSPDALFHLKSGESGVTPSASYDDLFIESDTEFGITLGVPGNDTGKYKSHIVFADAASNYQGDIYYDHQWDSMVFRTGNNLRMAVQSAGLTVHQGLFINPYEADHDSWIKWDSGTALFVQGSDGYIGMGKDSPSGQLDIQGEIVLQGMTPPIYVADAGILYASETYGVIEVFAKGSDGAYQQISNHGDSRYFEFDPEDPLPWIYRGGNTLLGKGVDVNLSQLFIDLEDLLGKQYLFYYDLSESEQIDPETWVLSQKRRIALQQKPEEEISFSEAWEVAEVMEEATRVMTKAVYEPDFESGQVLSSTKEIVVSYHQGTGRYQKQFKADVRFDESTGKCYRSRTEEDLSDEELQSIRIHLPKYITDRLVKGSR